MKSRALLPLSLFFVLPACGDDSSGDDQIDEPDAAMIDAGPIRRLDVQIDEMTVCPDGWSEGPTAADLDNRIEITASCDDGGSSALLQYAPKPTAGGSADCTQVTLQISGGPRANCRVNNQVLMPPEGMLTLSSGDPAMVSGECGCTGDEQGGGSEGGASFQLPLE